MAPTPDTAIFREIKNEIGRQLPGPLYRQIAEKLAERIERGELIAGQPLPRQRAFGKLLGVGEVTVRRALKHLESRGMVIARPGSGTAVADTPAPGSQGHRRRVASRGSGRRLRLGVVSLGSTDGYPFIQPLIQTLNQLGRDPRRSSRGVVWSQHFLPTRPAEHPSTEAFLRDALPLGELDGLAMMSPASVPLIALCQECRTPYVLAFNELADGHSPCVVVDYGSALLDAVTRQHENGARRFALMTSQRDRFSTGRLAEAFRVALQANGLDPDAAPVVAAGYHAQHGTAATQQLFAEGFTPDSIFYASTPQALGGREALVDAGLELGRDVQVTAIADRPDTALPFHWMVLPLEALACGLFEALTGPIQPATAGPRLVTVRCRYVHTDEQVSK